LNPVGHEPVDYLPLEVFRLWIERVTPPKVSGNVMPCPLVRNDSLGERLRRTIVTPTSRPDITLQSLARPWETPSGP